MPKISIIVPVYNVEQYLNRCVDSILNQTFTDFELILVNDGSTDESAVICDEYAKNDERIKVIHKNNGGSSSARNDGIKIATGELVTFVDSDDYIDENMYSEMIPLCNYCDMCMCNCYIVDLYDNKCKKLNHRMGDKVYNSRDILLNGCFYQKILGINMIYKIYKLSIIKKYNVYFDECYKVGEDLLFNIDYIAHSDKIQMVDKPYYYYTVNRDGSVMTEENQSIDWNQKLNFMDEMLCKAGTYEIEVDFGKLYYNTQLILHEYIIDLIVRNDVNSLKKFLRDKRIKTLLKYSNELPYGIKYLFRLLMFNINVGLCVYYLNVEFAKIKGTIKKYNLLGKI